MGSWVAIGLIVTMPTGGFLHLEVYFFSFNFSLLVIPIVNFHFVGSRSYSN
jgi:hypothetical protein